MEPKKLNLEYLESLKGLIEKYEEQLKEKILYFMEEYNKRELHELGELKSEIEKFQRELSFFMENFKDGFIGGIYRAMYLDGNKYLSKLLSLIDYSLDFNKKMKLEF